MYVGAVDATRTTRRVQISAQSFCIYAHAFAPLPQRRHALDVQISRIALRGDCLLSAGHDGHVNHYKISYPSPSEPHATAGQCRQTGKDANVLGCPASSKPHLAAGDWPVRAEGRRKDMGAPDRKGGGSSLKGFGHFLPSSTTPPAMLTLVTCYATSPITAVSDLWVGGGLESGGENMGIGEEARSSWATETGKLRIAVAGRSGSSRMSVWDLTQARQLLEVSINYQSDRSKRKYTAVAKNSRSRKLCLSSTCVRWWQAIALCCTF